LHFITNYLHMTSLSDSEELKLREEELINSIELVPDLVILVGGSSYLMIDSIKSNWADVPVILAGETDYICPDDYTIRGIADPNVSKRMILPMANENNLTLVETPICIEEEIELARRITPDMQSLIFIAGENYQSRQLQIILEKYMSSNYPDVNTRILLATEMTTDELISVIMNSSDDKTAIIYGSWLRHDDYLKNIVTRNNVLRLIEGFAPIISMSAIDFNSYPDVIGYCTYDNSVYDNEIKTRILAILDNGVQAREIPSVKLDAISSYVNKSALEKYGLRIAENHANDIYKKGILSFWDKYKYWVYFYILLTIVILALGASYFSLKIAHQKNEAIQKLSGLMDELKTANENAENARNEALKLKENAEKASAMKSRFLQNMSHDVRTPLNAIVGFSQLLSLPEGMISDEERNEYQSFISSNANILMMLVDDILNMSDVESGNYKINKTPGNCNELCRQTIKSVEYRVQPGVELSFTSEVDDTFLINTDERRVQQVLTNFLTNACKHTESGTINLHCCLNEDTTKVNFIVTDTGEGIPEDKSEKIFERFTKLDAYVEGAGIGLNICTTIAAKLGGGVSLDKTYTDGARFILTIPF